RCASSHRDDPLRFRHLLPELSDDWRHLVRHPSSDDDQVRLTRGWTENFSAEAGDVEARRAHRHHLDRAAGQAKAHRPNRTLAEPVDGRVHRGEHDSLRRVVAVSQLFDDALSVLSRHVGSEADVVSHDYYYLITNRIGPQPRPPTGSERSCRTF